MVLLDLDEADIVSISRRVCDEMIKEGQLAPELREKVVSALCSKHVHQDWLKDRMGRKRFAKSLHKTPTPGAAPGPKKDLYRCVSEFLALLLLCLIHFLPRVVSRDRAMSEDTGSTRESEFQHVPRTHSTKSNTSHGRYGSHCLIPLKSFIICCIIYNKNILHEHTLARSLSFLSFFLSFIHNTHTPQSNIYSNSATAGSGRTTPRTSPAASEVR